MSGTRKKLLITGGLGNLGSWMTDYFSGLLEYEVSVLAKRDRELNIEHPYVKVFGDVTDAESMEAVFDSVKPEYVIHLASVNETFMKGYAKEALLVNALGTRNILDAVVKNPVRKLIYFSTFHVYGVSSGHIVETQDTLPVNDYGLTHLFAEQYVKMYNSKANIPFIIFRLSNSYGSPKDKNSSKFYLAFNDFCIQAFNKQKIILNTNGTAERDFIYMGDVCSITQELLEMDSVRNQVFNLGSGKALSILSVASEVCDAYFEMFGVKVELQVNENDKTVTTDSLSFDISKLMQIRKAEISRHFKSAAKRMFSYLQELNNGI